MLTSCISFSTTKLLASARPQLTLRRRPTPLRLLAVRCRRFARSPWTDDVIAAVRRLSDKQCATDPLPTHLLTEQAMGQWVMGQWVKRVTFQWVTWVMGHVMFTHDPSTSDELSTSQ